MNKQEKLGVMVGGLCLFFLVGFSSVSYSQNDRLRKSILDLKHKDARIRGKAIMVLAELGDTRAIEPLISVLIKDEYYDIQWKAAWALGKLGNPASAKVNALIEQLPCEKKYEIYKLAAKNFPQGAINEPQECQEESRVKGKLSLGDTVIVSGVLNGTHRVEFFLDTGASHVVITEEDAQALNLDLTKAPMVQGQLADGRIIENPMVKLDSIAIGTVEARDIPVIVNRYGKTRLLGMSFLNNFPNMGINWKTGEITLE